LIQARRDHWVQSLGRCCLDRSVIDSDDVAQSHVDNEGRHPGVRPDAAHEPSNGQVPQNGSALNAKDERQMRDSMQIEKVIDRVKGAEEGQQGDHFEDILGHTIIDTEGDKEEDKPFEEILSHNRDMTIKKNCKVNIPSGQYDLREVRGDLGQRINGPS